MKYQLSLISMLFVANALFSQPLFTYGDKSVSKKDFLTAFSKNPPTKEERRKALDEYLGLYINYKLKVQAGYDEELNKQPSFMEEGRNFRRQIAENVINEEVGIKRLTDEAFERSEKDIHVAQIFVEVKPSDDTLKAYKQINAAYKALQEGKPFGDVAANFSSDASAKRTRGDIGYITAFTFSYAFESEIYKLKPGTYSKPYKSSIGYHIFKNMGERPALGKRKIAQLRLATPKGFSKEERNEYSILADSIYDLLKKGEPFEKAVQQFSNDYKTAANGGVVGDVSVGDYDADFEKEVFALKNVGDISKPFATAFGYHIIKLLEKKPAPTSINDANAYAEVKQVVEKKERLATCKKKALENRWLVVTKYKPGMYNQTAFKEYTDSNIMHHITNGIKEISDTTLLFSFEKKKIYAADWAVYITAKITKVLPDYSDNLKEFVNTTCTQYYTDNLELYSKAMQDQCKEFDEANVLFAAMDRHVWGKSSANPDELKAFYEKNKAKYQWKESVSGILVNAKSKEAATEIASRIKAAPQDWHKVADSYGSNVTVDSSRYEVSQLPFKQHIESKEGFETTPEKNANDDGYSFIYVIKSHPLKEQRSFEDAKGAATNDYQQKLEAEWLATLKKKYPVKVNDAVWKTIQ